MMDRRRVKAGDTKRREWQLMQRGSPVDLTGATEVKMFAALAPGQSATGTTSLSGTCTIQSPTTDGRVLEPAGGTGALAEALYLVEFQVTNGGETETIPDEGWELVEVLEDLGP